MGETTEQPEPKKPVRVQLKNVARDCIAELFGEEIALQVEQCQADKINQLATQLSTPTPTLETQPVKRDLGWLANGAVKAAKAMTLPETEESKARLAICESCDQWTGKSCKICGCFVKLKVKIPEEKCPAGKW